MRVFLKTTYRVPKCGKISLNSNRTVWMCLFFAHFQSECSSGSVRRHLLRMRIASMHFNFNHNLTKKLHTKCQLIAFIFLQLMVSCIFISSPQPNAKRNKEEEKNVQSQIHIHTKCAFVAFAQSRSFGRVHGCLLF